jgi:hypothetical protein
MIPGMFKLGGKLIEDKDKKAEYAFKVQEMMQALAFKLLETKTYPWIDGLVKLSYAAESIVKNLFRPVASAGLFLYAMANPEMLEQLHAMGAIGDAGIAGMFGAFPGWMASRHSEKKKKPVDDDW